MMRRRDRRRQETIDDIKDTARNQLTGGGAGRDLHARHRPAPSHDGVAVHYYFPSRQALLDALIIDRFTSLAEALRTTHENGQPACMLDRVPLVTRSGR